MLAFVFVFSIIITSVGLVTVVGFSVLDDLQSSEQALNAERAFQSLGYNLGNVERGHAPGRAGEVQLSGGGMYVRDNSEITVEIDSASGIDRTISRPLGTLYYDMTDRRTNITYEGGAVFREERHGDPIVVSEPNFRCDTGGPGPNVALVSILEMSSDDASQGGSGTVQVIGREQSSTLPAGEPDVVSGSVNVTITNSRFTEAWDSYFTNNGWSSGGQPNSWECTVGPAGEMDIYVRHTVIDISFVTG